MPNDFAMMDGQAGFLPYDSRGPPPHMQQQRAMPPQYVVEAPYTTAPMPGMVPAPQYQQPQPQQQQNGFAYVGYHNSPHSVHSSSPFKQEYQERPVHREMGPHDNSHGFVDYAREPRQFPDVHMRPPPSRSASIASSNQSTSSNPTAHFKTITYNETLDPTDSVEFDTEVDQLMRAVQAKPDGTQIPTPAHTPRPDMDIQDAATPQASPVAGRKLKKKWVCDGPNCEKRFVQKTHLDIHRRTHTGQRPYVCPKPNCGLTFSQRGNLKTHVRRHTGEKPYSCSLCGKMFAQRGNVRSHELTHKGLKPFVCRLDDCNKTFSQLGNMKTHQNNFHKETLKNLTSSFVKFIEKGEVPDSHRELFDYFKEHYKNSNKGVKGRGKDRAVAIQKPRRATKPAKAPETVTPYTPPQSFHQDAPHSDGMNGYSLQHSPMDAMTGITRNEDASYVVFSQPQGIQGPSVMYEDEHSRQMGFTDNRMY